MGGGKGTSGARAWVGGGGRASNGMNNGTGAEVAGAPSADSALSSPHWLLQEVTPLACTCPPSLGHPCLGQAGLD